MSKKKKTLHRQKCEVYSRIVGYIRPTQSWNDGKKAEFDIRQEFQPKTA